MICAGRLHFRFRYSCTSVTAGLTSLLTSKKQIFKMRVYSYVLILTICFGYCLASPAQNGKQNNDQCSATQLALSANDFGFELTKQIGGEGNLFISPLSIYIALAMVYLGAGGRTANQMESAFQLQTFGLDGGKLHEAFRNLLTVLKDGNDEYSLLLANGLFAQQNFSLNTAYVEDTNKFYDATVRLVDFLFRGEATKNEINHWVAEKTLNKIQDFLQDPLNPSTRLAILNAIYFKGIWKTQFSPQNTEDGTFYKSNGETKQVKYMIHREMKFRYLDDAQTNYKFLELPYKGEHITMLLALPLSDTSEPNLEISSSLLCRINSSMSSTKLASAIIPKFKMDCKKDLKEVLVRLGISDVFTGSADLSGIRKEKDLLVSEVKHVAVIEVNEEGSEAAAVTGIFITRLAINTRPEFIANHPFLFYIIDNRNGLVLFSGRVVDPQ